MGNNYEQQKLLSQDERFRCENYINEFEARTGLFNASLSKNSEIYLVVYLNALIHGLLSVQEQNQQISLITFNVGDLLRNKCYSKENEIIGLYQELLRIDHHRPDLLRIVSVRNRLTYITKDILINLMYRDSIVIEMQLGVKVESKFIENSDKMNHLIYELQMSIFQPMVELSNTWIALD